MNEIERRDDMTRIEDRLYAERPIPSAQFRGELGRRLFALRSQHPGRVRALVAVCVGSGSTLLAVAGIGVAGIGPFAA